MEVPKLGAESELQLSAYIAATATGDLSCICARVQLQQPGYPCGDGQYRRMQTETASLSLLSGRWTSQILLAEVAVYIDSLIVTYSA